MMKTIISSQQTLTFVKYNYEQQHVIECIRVKVTMTFYTVNITADLIIH